MISLNVLIAGAKETNPNSKDKSHNNLNNKPLLEETEIYKADRMTIVTVNVSL